MENRMTICNMTIEGGGRAGMIAPDETTFEYVKGRPGAPKDFDAAVAAWRELPTEDGASFDREVDVDAAASSPMVTWGTTPGMVVEVTDAVPDPAKMDSPADRETAERALAYMDLKPGTPMAGGPRPSASSSAPAPTRGSPTCARLPRSSRAARSPTRSARHGRPGLGAGQGAGRGGGPRRGLQGRRLRVARRRLLDVPGHEPRHPQARASAAPRPRTATSRAARAPAGAPTWSARRWPPRPRSRGTSSTSGSGADADGPGRDHRGPRRRARPLRRRHRPDHPEAVPQADRAHRLRRVPLLRLVPLRRDRARGAPDPGHRAQLRLAAPRASTPSGRSRTTASTPSSRPRSRTSSIPTAPRTGCCR